MRCANGQLTLCARAASGVLVPVTDNRVTLVLDQVKIVGNDLLDRLAKAAEIALLPGAELVASTAVRFFISSSAGS